MSVKDNIIISKVTDVIYSKVVEIRLVNLE